MKVLNSQNQQDQPKQNIKIFHHNDLDGILSAYWVKCLYNLDDYDNLEFFKITYGDEFPFNKINKDDMIWILDYSILPEEMDKLLEIVNVNQVIWIDHHKTAIERYKGYRELLGVRRDGFAACVLTFVYCFFNQKLSAARSDKELEDVIEDVVPEFCRLIGDYDVYKFKYGEAYTKSFYFGLNLKVSSPNNEELNEFIYCHYDETTSEKQLIQTYQKIGSIILSVQNRNAKTAIKKFSYPFEFEGYKFRVINTYESPNLFRDMLKDVDAIMTYCYNGKEFEVSMRSDKIDVSKIAKKYGGGGHAGAAGFQIKDNIFQISDAVKK